MATDLDQLKIHVGNTLREELPKIVPGLTKLAYEQIVQDAVDSLPKNIDQFDAEMEKIASGPSADDMAAWFRKNSKTPLIGNQQWASMKGKFLDNAAHVAGGVGVLAAAGATMFGLNKAVNAAQKSALHPAFMQALETAIRSPDKAGEILRGADRQKVVSYGETIFNYAPNVATDPNLLKGILANAIDYGSLDPATIRSLMELEEKRKNLHSWKPTDILAKG